MKCETPARAARSSREPTSIQNPSETERTLATRSVMTRSPESSSLRTTFCTAGWMVGERPAGALRAGDEAEHGAVPLRLVQRLVGEAEERLRVVRVLGIRRAPEACAEVGGPRLSAVGQLLEQRFDPRDDLAGVIVGRLRQENRELVAADAERVVRLPQRLGKHVRERHERLVPGRMAEAVVELLEAVEVRDHEAERAAVAHGPRDLALEPRHERATVEETSERIVIGEEPELAR